MTTPTDTTAQPQPVDMTAVGEADLAAYLAIMLDCALDMMDLDPAAMRIDLRDARTLESVAPEMWVTAADVLNEVRRRHGDFCEMPDSMEVMN